MKTTFSQILYVLQFTSYHDRHDNSDYINEYLEFLHSWNDWDSWENRAKYRGLANYILCMNLWIIVKKLQYRYQYKEGYSNLIINLKDFLYENKIPINEQFDYQYILGYLFGFSDRYKLGIDDIFKKEES